MGSTLEKECRICGGRASASVTTCHDCGNEFPPVLVKKVTWKKSVVIWIFLLSTSCALFGIIGGKGGHSVLPRQETPTGQTGGEQIGEVIPQKDIRKNVQPLASVRAAAEKGDGYAQCVLGDEYSAGKRVPRDMGEALRWYRLAADQGNLAAQFRLGRIFENGDGVERNLEEAGKWYRMASSGGNSDAGEALTRLGL